MGDLFAWPDCITNHEVLTQTLRTSVVTIWRGGAVLGVEGEALRGWLVETKSRGRPGLYLHRVPMRRPAGPHYSIRTQPWSDEGRPDAVRAALTTCQPQQAPRRYAVSGFESNQLEIGAASAPDRKAPPNRAEPI